MIIGGLSKYKNIPNLNMTAYISSTNILIQWHYERHKKVGKYFNLSDLDKIESIEQMFDMFFLHAISFLPNQFSRVVSNSLMSSFPYYEAYTDGSCNNATNRKGGAAYIILKDNKIIKEANKHFAGTTSNRMEMLAIISAINSIPEMSAITIHSDSKYAINIFSGINHPSANTDLVGLFYKCSKNKIVRFNWVKGHAGNVGNEYVDRLASISNQ